MDRFKFRIWDNQENKYYEPTYEAYKGNLEELLLSSKGELMMRTSGGCVHESCFRNRFTIEQCTGLKDKNGKLIFEKDVVVASWYSHDEPIIDIEGEVMYSEGWNAFVIYDKEEKAVSEMNGQGCYTWEIEIIGNIHYKVCSND